MNNILEYIESGAFNELIRFPFEEVRSVFNLNKYFVLDEHGDRFIHDTEKVKSWYIDELNKVEVYAKGEYASIVNSGIDVPEFDAPQYRVRNVEVQTKRKLIQLIIEYFNKDLFQLNKPQISGCEILKEEAIETPHEMLVALNVNKNRIYSLLSILGYYQRHFGYFLSRADFLNICYDYSNQVHFINKNLGMEYRFVNIFIGNQRIKPSKKKKTDVNVDTNIDNFISEQLQSNKYIDIDKISLLMLVQPYLKSNTQEIYKINEIMANNFKKYRGAMAWEKTLEETKSFIAECEAKGIMKRLV